jgi:hypothetical protein
MQVQRPDAAQLIARAEIEDALMRYTRGNDRADWDLIRSAYWPDAFHTHGEVQGTVEDLIEWIKAAHTKMDAVVHFMGNIHYEFVSADLAFVESYMISYQDRSDGIGISSFYMVGNRYLDRFERRDGEWRIGRRVCPLTFSRPGLLGADAPQIENGIKSTRGPDDPLWAFRRDMGLD